VIPEARENGKQVALFKWHIRIVLQDGERMYLNVYKSPSASISRSPTSQAAAKLVKKDEGERRMNLVDRSWKEISILGDTVDVIDQVTPGSGILGVRDWLDMILGGEDAYRVDRLLLTCWKTKEEQQGGWAHNINQAELEDQWRPLARRPRK
jgi:hypothetical protein